jgi:hypothetical protein
MHAFRLSLLIAGTLLKLVDSVVSIVTHAAGFFVPLFVSIAKSEKPGLQSNIGSKALSS